jgi:2-polyprenyl-3-methyl-5-hydroxy-6-metoxy-1,4-benzoquinol methylase
MQKRGANVDCYDKFYQTKPIFENKMYDLITSTEVFEHLFNPLDTLKELSHHLNPKGHIAIMTLFHARSMEHFWAWWYRRDPTHITFFTPRTFEVMAKMCDLEIIKTDEKRVIILQKR